MELRASAGRTAFCFPRPAYPVHSSVIRRPAVSVTGRENTMDFALLSMPAFSMIAFMIAFFFSVCVTM